MKSLFLSLSTFLLCFTIHSQKADIDVVSEKTDFGFTVKGINNTDIQQQITLTLDVHNLKGYTKPIVMLIPANSTVKMIDLTKVPNEYNNLKFKFSHKAVPNAAESGIYNKKLKAELFSEMGIKAKGIVVFSKNECSRCDLITTTLKDSNLDFKLINVTENPESNRLMWKLLRIDYPKIENISMPVVMVDGKLSYEIKDINDFVGKLK